MTDNRCTFANSYLNSAPFGYSFARKTAIQLDGGFFVVDEWVSGFEPIAVELSGGHLQPTWLFRRKANPSSPSAKKAIAKAMSHCHAYIKKRFCTVGIQDILLIYRPLYTIIIQKNHLKGDPNHEKSHL